MTMATINEPATAHDATYTCNAAIATAIQYDNFDLAYETLSGELVVVWSRQASNYNGYRTYGAASGWGTPTALPGTARAALQTYAVGNPRTNQIMALVTRSGAAALLGYIWDGGAWSAQTSVATTIVATGTNKKWITGQWLNVGGTDYGVAVWATNTAGTVGYRPFSAGAWGTAGTNATGVTSVDQWLDSDVDPNVPDTLMLSLSYSGATPSLLTRRLVLTAGPAYTWTTPAGGQLTAALPNVITQCFSFTFDHRDLTAPTAGTVTVSPTAGTYTSPAPTISTTFTDNDSQITSCEYTTDGATWMAGTVSGSMPTYTCTAAPTGLVGSLTINMRATSAGGMATAVAVTRTVDGAGPTDGTLTVTPGTEQIALSWTAAFDAASGLRTINTYEVRFLAGAIPPTCSTGTVAYTGTALSFTHTSLTQDMGTQFSYRVCAYDDVDNPSTGLSATAAPKWSAVTTNCGRCHAYPPRDGATRGSPAGAVVGSHQAHPFVCSTCHMAPATETSVDYIHRNSLIDMQGGATGISGGYYDKDNSGTYSVSDATFTQTSTGTTATCINVSCHGGVQTPQWGVGTLSCVDCHNAALGTRRIVTTEFAQTWSHKRSAGRVVTGYDCGVCHMEGAVSGNVTTGKTDPAYHANGTLELRDPDTGTTIEGATWGGAGSGGYTSTGVPLSFTNFSRNLGSSTLEASTVAIEINLCLKCHDANGSTAVHAPGGSPEKPFATTIAGAAYTGAGVTANGVTGGVTDISASFATTNSSYHPVLGKQNNWYAKLTRMAAPWNTATRGATVDVTSWGPLISCWDCHAPVGATGVQTVSVTAHGAAATLRGSPTASATAAPALGTNEATLCKVCHAGYDNTANPNGSHGTGSAATGLNRNEKNPFMNFGCNMCHSSGYDTPVARPIRAMDVHGVNTLPPATVTLSGRWLTDKRPYAFIRNATFLGNHQPTSIGGTPYTAQCVMAGSGGGGVCNNQGAQTYTIGGTY